MLLHLKEFTVLKINGLLCDNVSTKHQYHNHEYFFNTFNISSVIGKPSNSDLVGTPSHYIDNYSIVRVYITVKKRKVYTIHLSQYRDFFQTVYEAIKNLQQTLCAINLNVIQNT